MSLQDMINDFQNILNRTDCSALQAQTFITQGLRRIMRECRLPSMERALIITPGAAINFITAPTDLLQPIDILWTRPDGRLRALNKLSYRQLQQIDPMDSPTAYARLMNQYWIAGSPQAGEQVQFLYYGNFTPFATVNSENELSASSPDLGTYAGLAYAGQAFRHPSADQWETIYQTIKAEVVQMGIDLDAEGGPQIVQPLYSDED